MNPKIKIYGPIGGDSEDAITMKSIDAQLEAIGEDVKEIDVLINSDGGSVSQGLGIVKLLQDHPAKIHTVVQGSAASIAGYIACCGDTRTIEKDSIFHIHGPHVGTEGNLSDHEQSVELLQVATSQMAGRYSELSGKTTDEITEEFKVDKYYTPEMAVELGYMTDVGNATAIAAILDTKKFSVPDSFLAALARRREPQPKDDNQMSKNPASLKDLKAKFKGASAEFLLEHALSESSMDEVTASYIDDLEAKNKSQVQEIAKLKAAMDEDEAEAMDEEEETVAEQPADILQAIKAMIDEAVGMEDEEEEVVAEEDEEAVAEDDEEAVAMDEDEADASDDTLAANSMALRHLAAMLGKVGSKSNGKSKAKASGKRPTTGKGRHRTGARAVKKSVTNASRTASLSASQQIQKLAQDRMSKTGEAKHIATRAILKDHPKLHDRMLSEVKA